MVTIVAEKRMSPNRAKHCQIVYTDELEHNITNNSNNHVQLTATKTFSCFKKINHCKLSKPASNVCIFTGRSSL